MQTKNAPGTYVLVLHNRGDLSLDVGSLGMQEFNVGWYLYVGSAMSGLSARMRRHFKRRKVSHWHIDYLTKVTRIAGAMVLASGDRLECGVADKLKTRMSSIAGFGCSDCECRSHLFFAASEVEAWSNVESAVASFDVDCQLMKSKELRAFLNRA